MNQDSSQSAEKVPKRRREKEVSRKHILESAETIFAEEGYHAASLTAIAARADFAVGTLYLYFEDKADLYGTVLLEKMQQMVEMMEGVLTAEGSPVAILRQAVHSHFGFRDANRQFFEIFLHQSQIQGSPLHERHWTELEALKKRHLVVIEACIVRGQAAGEIRPGNPHLYAVAFLGIILQMVRQWVREKGGPLSESADFAADCFLHGAASPRTAQDTTS